MNTLLSLSEKINNAKDLDFTSIFNASIELFKKTWIQGFLLQLFTFIIMLPLVIILYIPVIGMIIRESQEGRYEPQSFDAFFAGFSVFYIICIIIGAFVLGAVSVALNAGFFRIMKKLDEGESTGTSDFFYFIKGHYLSKTLLLTLITVAIAIPAALLCYVPLIYTMVPFSFFTIIFAFNPELNVGDIVKVSFKLGHKKWLIAFGLLIVASILAQFVGLLLCGVGLLFTSAFVYHPTYLIYKEVIGWENNDEIQKIGTDLIE